MGRGGLQFAMTWYSFVFRVYTIARSIVFTEANHLQQIPR